jgi:hypothetical protein
MAWMVFQVVSLSALVPRDCCEAHAHKAAMPSSHDHTGAHCPMQAADGKPCPMHEAPASEHHHHGTVPDETAPPDDGCMMRGSCDGPDAGFIALLSHAGMLTESAGTVDDLDMQPAVDRIHEQVVSRLESPDPPPPRV